MRAMKASWWLVACGVCWAACSDDGSESNMNPAQPMSGAAAPITAGSAAPAAMSADLAAFMATGLSK